MNKLLCFVFALVVLLSLPGCRKDDATSDTSLVGTWQLKQRSCYCAPTALPDETLTFTSAGFSVYTSGVLTDYGTYTIIPAAKCSGKAALALRLTSNGSVVWSPRDAFYSISGNTLTLDYNIGCLADGVVETYERLP